jgi:hypothetical protein
MDPIDANINFFEKVVDSIYRGVDCSYVVYNKSFERSRLKEMIFFIPHYEIKILQIIENLYDLADFFDLRKDILRFKNLKGFYSIKKVLTILPEHTHKLSGAVPYSSLEEIKNGMEAQQKTLLRFFKLIDNDQ